MNCDIVDLSQESPDDDCEILVDNNCSLAFLNIDLQTEDVIPELAELIKQCLKIENSTGMMRVIKRSLMRLYKEACPNYLQSTQFRTLVNNTSHLIVREPHFKFFHIKSLCEALKSNKKRKRAELVTLGPCTKRKAQFASDAKRRKIEIINLDDIEDEERDKHKEVVVPKVTVDEKESKCLDNKIEILIPPIDVPIDMHEQWLHQHRIPENQNNHQFYSNDNTIPIEIIHDKKADNIKNEDPTLSVVQRIEQANNENVKQLRIKRIESEIADLKTLIEQLDKAEVKDNSKNSPYVLSELYKEKVVKLYQELCALTDSQPVKRHEIHIKVSEGHAEGPARILENLLNNNLRSNGYPPFPTFAQVKKCVDIANIKYNLAWRPTQIYREALELFTRCGRALQKLRQQREWGHLWSRVKREDCEDPADSDELLKARLEANMEIAKRKENDILDRYASLEYKLATGDVDTTQSVQSVNGTSQNHKVVKDASDDSGSESDIVWDDDHYIDGEMCQPVPVKVESNQIEVGGSTSVKEECEVKNEDVSKLLEKLGDDYTTKIIDIEDPFLTVEISDSSDEEVL
ncbi:uncharacterized protein LOC119840248 [Zerene cesonia]|uniref:uncharacterized protein LOC119840248 n=1 Tax=Zerene cesonia TaxID=33412 RepID=UPI0018E587CB|nr:uncharacterized protein LOC119840248 [Zerene cesonia]